MKTFGIEKEAGTQTGSPHPDSYLGTNQTMAQDTKQRKVVEMSQSRQQSMKSASKQQVRMNCDVRQSGPTLCNNSHSRGDV